MVYSFQNSSQHSHLFLTSLDECGAHEVPNGFKIIWLKEGTLVGKVDSEVIEVSAGNLLLMAPNQKLEISASGNGVVWQYNRDFYCILDHDQEVGCIGLLHYGSMRVPIVRLRPDEARKLGLLQAVFIDEFQTQDNIQEEMLQMLLKRLIILSTRMLKEQESIDFSQHHLDLIRRFHVLVELHFREKQKVSDYADMLYKSPKTLSNLFSQHNESSPLRQIHERIALEAKRLLVFTDKSIKEIGYDLNVMEEAHFSRFFKRLTGLSPTAFREKNKTGLTTA